MSNSILKALSTQGSAGLLKALLVPTNASLLKSLALLGTAGLLKALSMQSHENRLEALALLGTACLLKAFLSMQGNEGLLKVFLQYIQRCCSSSSPQTAVHLLGPELADLLHGGRVVRPEVRHGALSAIYAAMTAAMQAEEVGCQA